MADRRSENPLDLSMGSVKMVSKRMPKKTSPGTIFSEYARRRWAKADARSPEKRGGRPKVLRPCPTCGSLLGTVEMRAHKCPAKIKSK